MAVPLFLLDGAVQEGSSGIDLWITPWVGLIAGVWGAIGGLTSGGVCALIVRQLDKRGERPSGRVDATVGGAVTAAFATAFSLTQFFDGRPDGGGFIGWWDAVVWFLIPIPIVTAVAATAGWRIWRRTLRSELLERAFGI